MKIRKSLWIEEVSFLVESCSDSLLLRVNLYQIEGDTVFTPLHRIPFYVLLLPGRSEQVYTVDVSEGTVVASPGNILITIQPADFLLKGALFSTPLYLGKTYARRTIDSPFKKDEAIAVKIDFQVYGRLLSE